MIGNLFFTFSNVQQLAQKCFRHCLTLKVVPSECISTLEVLLVWRNRSLSLPPLSALALGLKRGSRSVPVLIVYSCSCNSETETNYLTLLYSELPKLLLAVLSAIGYPIVLRTAKTPLSFGCLSAIGLRYMGTLPCFSAILKRGTTFVCSCSKMKSTICPLRAIFSLLVLTPTDKVRQQGWKQGEREGGVRNENDIVASHESMKEYPFSLTLLHSERPKLQTILAFLSAIGLKKRTLWHAVTYQEKQHDNIYSHAKTVLNPMKNDRWMIAILCPFPQFFRQVGQWIIKAGAVAEKISSSNGIPTLATS